MLSLNQLRQQFHDLVIESIIIVSGSLNQQLLDLTANKLNLRGKLRILIA
jgi:hypothetical protein